MDSKMSRKQAIEDLKSLQAYFLSETGGSCPECLPFAIEALQDCEFEKNKEQKKLLKKRKGDYVTYRYDYLLDHLAREVYLLESYRKWKEENAKNDDA